MVTKRIVKREADLAASHERIIKEEKELTNLQSDQKNHMAIIQRMHDQVQLAKVVAMQSKRNVARRGKIMKKQSNVSRNMIQ